MGSSIMAGVKRLAKELDLMTKSLPPGVLSVSPGANEFVWKVVLAPTTAPFDKYLFDCVMTFPTDYPFKAPEFEVTKGIYHPNFDSKSGKPCLADLVSNWKPACKAKDVLAEIVKM